MTCTSERSGMASIGVVSTACMPRPATMHPARRTMILLATDHSMIFLSIGHFLSPVQKRLDRLFRVFLHIRQTPGATDINPFSLIIDKHFFVDWPAHDGAGPLGRILRYNRGRGKIFRMAVEGITCLHVGKPFYRLA